MFYDILVPYTESHNNNINHIHEQVANIVKWTLEMPQDFVGILSDVI